MAHRKAAACAAQTPAPTTPLAADAARNLADQIDRACDDFGAFRAVHDLTQQWQLLRCGELKECMEFMRREDMAALLRILNGTMQKQVDQAQQLAESVCELVRA